MKESEKSDAKANELTVQALPMRWNAWASIITLCWLTPLLVCIVLAGILYWFITAGDLPFPPSRVSSIASSLSGVLAAVSAILVAVLMSVYVQGRRNRIEGFNIFLRALGDFKKLVPKIYRMSVESPLNEHNFKEWAYLADLFTQRMDKITPAWPGYAVDQTLEDDMDAYVNRSDGIIDQLEEGISDEVLDIYTDHKQFIRVMLMGLRAIDEGTVEQKLETRLFRVFLSLVALLVVCLSVNTIAGLDSRSPSNAWAFVNPFIYLSIPSISIGNFGALVYSVYLWQKDIQRRDKEWVFLPNRSISDALESSELN